MEDKKFYMVMLFFSEWEIGASDRRDVFVNVKNINCGLDRQLALDLYSNIRCPASQLIQADSLEELDKERMKMIDNFNNPDWVNELMEKL